MKPKFDFEEVKQVVEDCLRRKGLRKTSERFHILKHIYERGGHFDADTLYVELRNKGINVSRATVYNTLDLFTKCGILTSLFFTPHHIVYDFSYKAKQHEHLYCEVCGKIEEFCDPRLSIIEEDVQKLTGFKIIKRNVVFRGICSECQKKMQEKSEK
ncbi:MAG: transcriptional repressor [Chlorobi bacterium]|nr:transcriptional repressor [Chlorobiota bacterium]